jgi:hypothetical protein
MEYNIKVWFTEQQKYYLVSTDNLMDLLEIYDCFVDTFWWTSKHDPLEWFIKLNLKNIVSINLYQYDDYDPESLPYDYIVDNGKLLKFRWTHCDSFEGTDPEYEVEPVTLVDLFEVITKGVAR